MLEIGCPQASESDVDSPLPDDTGIYPVGIILLNPIVCELHLPDMPHLDGIGV